MSRALTGSVGRAEEMGHSRQRGQALSKAERLEGCTPGRVYEQVLLRGVTWELSRKSGKGLW